MRQATVIKLLLSAVLRAANMPAAAVLDLIKSHLAKLATPVSPATKAGVAIGFVMLVTYGAAFYVENDLERAVLLASTIGSLVAGYALGAKS
jgi:hypothetical protein